MCVSLVDDIRNAISDLNNKRTLWRARASEVCSKELQATLKDVWGEFGDYQRNKIASVFRSSMGLFYDAYQPQMYKREYSLYNLLQLPTDERGLVDYNDTMDLINRENVHLDRHGGDSLFETVFMEGWHGGAKHIDPGKASVWGEHPNPGSAYYRTKGMVTYPGATQAKWHRYGKWGKQAFRSKAPYTMFDEALNDAEQGEIAAAFQDISQKHWDMLCERLQADLQAIRREIYG